VRKNELLPPRTLLRASGRVSWVLRALTVWLAIVLVYGLALGLFQRRSDWDLKWQMTVGVAVGVICAAVAITGSLAKPANVTTTAGVLDSIAADRASSVFLGLAAGFPFGLWNGLEVYMTSPGYEEGLASAIEIGLPVALGWALGLILAGTAWGRWLISVRLWLPITGRLPWRVIGFLDDAHRRGVFRQVGAVYQFRHARLQDYLTASAVGQTS
jgi:hypothetical protein